MTFGLRSLYACQSPQQSQQEHPPLPEHILREPPHSQGAPFFSTLLTASAKRMPITATTAIEAAFTYLASLRAGRNTAHRQKRSTMIAAAVQKPKPHPIASMPSW